MFVLSVLFGPLRVFRWNAFVPGGVLNSTEALMWTLKQLIVSVILAFLPVSPVQETQI
jgi:hypothetical protein